MEMPVSYTHLASIVLLYGGIVAPPGNLCLRLVSPKRRSEHAAMCDFGTVHVGGGTVWAGPLHADSAHRRRKNGGLPVLCAGAGQSPQDEANRLCDPLHIDYRAEDVYKRQPHPMDTDQPCEDESDTSCSDTENPDINNPCLENRPQLNKKEKNP